MEQLRNNKNVPNMCGDDEPHLIKSKLRVQKHGEVFTPQWVVDKMLSIPGIKEKAENIFATFLEPSAGEGEFHIHPCLQLQREKKPMCKTACLMC